MAEPIQLQSGLDYHTTFDPKMYLAHRVTAPDWTEGDFYGPILKAFHEIFDSGVSPGNRLIDIGSGPTIYQLISASRYCTEIVCSEYTEANRAEINKWVNGDRDMHDWTPFFKFVSALEGRQFDVMTTCMCLETACPDRGSYSAAVRNITRLLKPGGTLVLAAVTNQTFYTVGDYRFFTLPIDSSFIREVLEKAGYVDIEMKSFPADNFRNDTLSNYDKVVVLRARKAET